MPSSSYLQGSVGQLLANASYQNRGGRASEVLISPLTMAADQLGANLGGTASTTYNAISSAIGFQFCIAEPFLVQKVWWANGTTASTNNADVAVYSEDGATRIVAGGATLIAGANIIQEKDCTDTLLSAPGRYWAVYNQNGNTATPLCVTYANLTLVRFAGIASFSGAVPLGTTFTPAAAIHTFIPYFGIAGRVKAA